MNRLKSASKPLLIAGLIAGTLDGLAAVIMYSMQTGKDPMNIFRFIASGVFGAQAFNGGVALAIWGIVFHYIIAFGWTILFFWLAQRFLFLTHRWIISGVLYGIFVWLAMNLVVVPLSLVNMKPGPKEWTGIVKGILVLIACIGLPVSYAAKRWLKCNA